MSSFSQQSSSSSSSSNFTMDNWNADLMLHIIQYLNITDLGRLAQSARRYAYLVHQFSQTLRGPEMVARTSDTRSLRSTSSTESMAQQLTSQAAQALQSHPNLALAFSTLSSTLAEDLPHQLPTQCVTLGVQSGSIQSCNTKESGQMDCRSNAGLMLAHLPGASTVRPFIWEMMERDDSPQTLVNQLAQDKTNNNQDYKVFLVYASGQEASVAEDFVQALQAAFPQSTIVGGICTGGYCSQSTETITREELSDLSSIDLVAYYRGMGLRDDKSWTKAELMDRILAAKSTRPWRLRLLEEGAIYGVALAGDNIPVRSVVSRGVESLTNRQGTCEPLTDPQLVIHSAALHKPGDREYMFQSGARAPPYHIVRSVRDRHTDKVYTINQLVNQFQQPDFIGIQRANAEEGYDLMMPHPLSYNLDAYLFLLNESEDPLCSLEGRPMDLLDLTGESCLRDMDQTMQHLKEQTADEEVLGAIMVSCSARGPSATSMLNKAMADASSFTKAFPSTPCLGFYAGGEIGPMALAGARRNIFRQGQAALQGFTAVFALFIVPKFRLPDHALLNDDPQHVQEYIRQVYTNGEGNSAPTRNLRKRNSSPLSATIMSVNTIMTMFIASLALLMVDKCDAFSMLHVARNNHAFSPIHRRTTSMMAYGIRPLEAQKSGVESVIAPNKKSRTHQGLYRPFADQAWARLLDTGLLKEQEIASDLQFNQSPARGFPEGSVVDMEIKSLIPQEESCPIQYARYALLETIVPSMDEDNKQVHSQGIQVLNLVIYPKQKSSNKDSAWPVWGADFVSLPGGRHLLLLDAQPMHQNCQAHEAWKEWHAQYSTDFEWGGDFPPAVQRYVSPCALWTRMTAEKDSNAVEKIQSSLPSIVQEHLDIYLDLLLSETGGSIPEKDSWFGEYLTYRIENDPARPMLKSLYGEEWTERVLEEVLFPGMLR